jgi:hypothetical protein
MKVAIMHLHSWLWLTWHNSFVEYGARVASNFDDSDEYFGEGSLYYCFGVTRAPALLKTTHPRELPL